MSTTETLTPFKAASHILTWMEKIGRRQLPVDLNLVREMLPTTPFGQGTVIKAPMPINWASEGALVSNPDNPNEWGILYNDKARAERQRFTVAHELGHFVLHRHLESQFNCDKESIYSGIDTLKLIEREADDFAANLLMPGDLLRERIAGHQVDFRLLGDLAKLFGVSFETMCIRFTKYTDQRVVLVYWDYGFMKYQWPSSQAVRTCVKLHRTDDPQEPMPGTLAADDRIAQEWNGLQMPAEIWCSSEPSDITLRELKHTYADGNRVLSMLILESAAPRPCRRTGWEEDGNSDTYDRFIERGQFPY